MKKNKKFWYLWLLMGVGVFLSAGFGVINGHKGYFVNVSFSILFMFFYYVGSKCYSKYEAQE